MLKGLLAGLFVLAITLGTTLAASDNLTDQKQLVSLLQQGGYNLYIRHAATSKEVMDQRPVVFSHCDGQRNLSRNGRQDATEIGQAFTRLGIPVGPVHTSPFCRCKDTAQLAFGRFQVNQQLLFSFGLNKARRDQASIYLSRVLAQPPPAGTNTVFVSHSANLDEATGVWPDSEGGVYIFRPQSDGSPEYLGVITPAHWPTL